MAADGATAVSGVSGVEPTDSALRRRADAFASAGWGIAIGSADGERLEDVNAEFAHMHGYGVDELVGRPIALVFAPSAHEAMTVAIAQAHARGRHAFESVHLRRDGTTFPVLVDVTSVRGEDGDVAYRAVHVHDLTRQKAADEALRAATVSREVLDALVEGCQVIGFDGTYLYINEVAAQQGRSTPAALIGRKMVECYPGIDATPMFALLQRCLAERTHAQMENAFDHADGSRAIFELRFIPIPQGACILSLDVSAQRHRLDAIVHDSDDAIIGGALDGTVTSWNTGAERIFGYTSAEIVGGSMRALFPAHLSETEALLNARVGAGERIEPFETQRLRKDGRSVDLVVTLSPVCDATGEVVGVSQVARDVTAIKRAEETARRANLFLAALIENIPHMVFVKDAERLAFVTFNRAGEDLLGMSRAELIGKTDRDLFPLEDAAFFQAKDRETLAGGEILDIPEEELQTPHGRRLLHTKKVPVLDDAGMPWFLLGISEDITERRRDELARDWLAAIIDHSQDAIIGRGLDGLISSWNAGAAHMFGYLPEEVLGERLTMLFSDDHRDEERDLIERIVRGERVEHFETVRRRKDGTEVDVSVTLSPVRDASGALVGISKIARDISDFKRAQREVVRAKETVEAANRELEAFSYSVAHDLRAPLRSIDGFSQALLEDYGDRLDGEGRRYLAFVRESAQLMAQLIDDMLTLSRVSRHEIDRGPVDLTALATSVAGRLALSEPARDVVVAVQDGLVGDGDRRLLAVVLENLIGNAWKFTSKVAEARIEVGVAPIDGQDAYFVRDNGAGFDMAYANKLFGILQRLHSTADFEGTGVGLAIVLRVVSRHGGRVWARPLSRPPGPSPARLRGARGFWWWTTRWCWATRSLGCCPPSTTSWRSAARTVPSITSGRASASTSSCAI